MSPRHHDENSLPFNLSDTTKVRLPLVMLLGLVGFVASATLAWSSLRSIADGNSNRLTAHDIRLDRLEANQADIAVMRNDVLWIRKTLEQRDRRP